MENSRQNLTIEERPEEKKKRGCYLTLPTILFIITIFVAACIAVALIVWFAIPRKRCEIPTTAELVQSCKNHIAEVGKGECLKALHCLNDFRG